MDFLFRKFINYRIAANEKLYISSIMHVRDVRDKRRLIIKSTDVVLFGPPQGKKNCKIKTNLFLQIFSI